MGGRRQYGYVVVSSTSERLTDCWQFVFNYAFKDVLAGDEMSFGINPEAAADKSFELKPGLALCNCKDRKNVLIE